MQQFKENYNKVDDIPTPKIPGVQAKKQAVGVEFLSGLKTNESNITKVLNLILNKSDNLEPV